MGRWLIVLLLLLTAPSVAGDLLRLEQQVTRVDPTPAVRYLVDPQRQLDLAAALAADDSQWQQGPLHFGFSKASYWIRLELSASSAARGEWLLEVANPLLDEVDLYILRGDELYLSQSSGALRQLAERPVASSRLLFPFHLDPERPLTLVLRISSDGSLRLPLTLWRSEALLADSSSRALLQGLLLGMLLVMGLYNLFVFAASRLLVHLWYAGYVLTMAVLLAGLFGIIGSLWPALRHPAVIAAGPLVLSFAALFADGVMQFRRHLPQARPLLRLLVGINLALLPLALVLPYAVSVRLLVPLAMLMPLLLLATACWLAWKRVPLARAYVLAWLLLLLGAATSAALYSGWLQWPIASHLPLVAGALGEVIVLAALLAWRFATERQSRQRAQNRAVEKARRLRQLRDVQEREQASTRQQLEETVRGRTMELEIALRELQEVNQRLEELNTIDALTGVRNRAYFDKRYLAEQRRSRREETRLALVMLDIDHFKTVNDRFGHLVGDEVIRTVAQRAAAVLKRPADVICRYGGEEFALLLPSTTEAGAVAVAEAIRSAVSSEPIASPGGPLAITCSLGVASLAITPHTAHDALLASADAALYRAKSAGRNRVEVAPNQGERDALASA